MPTRKKTLESPKGRGKLFRGDELVAQPRYSLEVTQTLHTSNSFGVSGDETEGLRDVRGFLEIDPHLAGSLLGEDLVLQLEDGRRLPIFIQHNNGRIMPRGWFNAV